MTSDEIIEALLEIEVPGKLVAEIAKKLFTQEANEAAWEASRAASRASSQRYRDKQKLLVMSRDVTSCHVTSPENAILKKEESKKERKGRSIALPADFALNDADLAYAAKHGWGTERTAAEFERFKNHAQATGRRQADWHGTWRSWVTSPYSNRINGHSHGRETLKQQTDRLAADMEAKMRGQDRTAGSNQGRQANAIGLPGNQLRLVGRLPDDPM